jgi:Dyp-type peroxidase family
VEFRRGLRSAKLDDPPPKKWEPKFQTTIHAMLLLADDRVEVLTEQLSLLRGELRKFADVSIEFGLTMRNEAQNPIEHFGYADGVSQPLFFASDLKKAPKKRWDPSAGPNLVLVKDPHGGSRTACGTYLVFRKLEQNVRAFAERELALADALELQGDDRELAGAMVVGRFEDGTPVAFLHQQDRHAKKPQNDFRYARDPGGNKCPFASHIRKANPRTDEGKTHRIARRGITYGDPTPPGDDLAALPETGVGLLFQCCQADLADQFEFLQRAANDHAPLRPGTGKDPLIGQSARGQFPDLEFPNPRGSPDRAPFSFHSFVTMKGGEYFFVPSIRFLESLK